MQIARQLNLACVVEPEMTKVFRVTPKTTWTHGQIQHEMPYSIGVTGNFQATSASETLQAKPNQQRQRSHHPDWNGPPIATASRGALALIQNSTESVCVSNSREGCHALATSLAKSTRKSMRKSVQNRSRRGPGAPKIDSESAPGPFGTPHGAQERCESVSGASRERLGTSPARPGSAQRLPKDAPGRQKERPGAPWSAPRRPKSTPSGLRERKNRVFVARRVREAPSQRFFVDFC